MFCLHNWSSTSHHNCSRIPLFSNIRCFHCMSWQIDTLHWQILTGRSFPFYCLHTILHVNTWTSGHISSLIPKLKPTKRRKTLYYFIWQPFLLVILIYCSIWHGFMSWMMSLKFAWYKLYKFNLQSTNQMIRIIGVFYALLSVYRSIFITESGWEDYLYFRGSDKHELFCFICKRNGIFSI